MKSTALAAIILVAVLSAAAVIPAITGEQGNNSAVLQGPPTFPATIYGNVTIQCATDPNTTVDAPAGLRVYFYSESGDLLTVAETGNGTTSNNSYIAKIEDYTGTVQVYVEQVFIQNITVSSGDIIKLDILVVDQEPPAKPQLNASTNGTNLTITWSAPPDNLGISHYEYTVHHNGTLYANGTTTNTSIELNGLPDGSYTINVTAVDLACNTNTSTLSTLIDTKPPELIPVEWPQNGSLIPATPINITVLIRDAVSGLSQVQLLIDGQSTNVSVTQVNETAWTATASIVPGDGPHSLELSATDNAGNTATLSTSITVDTTPPSLELLEGPVGSWVTSEPVAYVFRATDNTSGVNWSSVTATATNATIISVEVDSANSTVQVVADPEPGNYSVRVEIADYAGHTSSLGVAAGYDPYPPVVVVESPAEGEVFNTSTVTIRLSIADNISGVDWSSLNAWIDGYGNLTLEIDQANGTASAQLQLPDGQYTLHVSVSDLAGLSARADTNFTVDTGAPQLQITGLTNGEYTNSTTLTVTVTATDPQGISTIRVYLDSELVGECNCTGNTTETLTTILSDLPQGTHVLVAEAEDTAGNKANITLSFTVDIVEPTITIASPGSGEYYPSGSVPLEATVEDLLVSEVRVLVDGNLVYTATPGLPTVGLSLSITGLDDGAHSVTVVAWDAAGNRAEETVIFYVDTSPPEILSVEPADGSYTNETSITITIIILENNDLSLQATLDNTPLDTTLERVNDTTWKAIATITATEGTHTLRITAQDPAGNTAETTITFTVDTTPPQATITTPQSGEWYNSSEITLEASASDNTALDKALVYIDGELVHTQTLDGASATISTVLTGLEDGVHTATVKVFDRAGNAYKASVEFNIDTAAPTITSISPPNGAILNTSQITIEIVVAEANNLTLQALLDGSELSLTLERIDSNTWRAQATVSLSEGQHSLSVKAVDQAGNAATATSSFIIDLTPPSITITSPENGSTLTSPNVTIVAVVEDNVSGVDWNTVVMLLDGEQVGYTYDPATGTITASVTLGEGTHTLTIKAADNAGNRAEATIQFYVSLGAPIVTLQPSGTVYTNQSTMNITISVSDDTGLENVTVWLDNNIIYQCNCNGQSTLNRTLQVGPLSDGEHTLVVRAYDVTGKEGNATLTIVVDRSRPQIEVEHPANGTVTNAPAIDLLATVSDDHGLAWITVALNGEQVNYTITPDGTLKAVLNLTEGENLLVITAADLAGNRASKTIVITLDTVPPTISVETSIPPVVNTTLLNLTVTLEDNVLVESLIIDAPTGSQVITVNETSAIITVQISLAPGENTIVLTAVDAAGNTASMTLQVYSDTSKPYLEVEADAGPVTNSTRVNLLITAADDYRVDFVTVETPLGNITVPVYAPNATLTVTVNLTEGANTIIVRAVDAAGNAATLQLSILVDTSPPTVNVEAPSITNRSTLNITVAAEDAASGLLRVAILINGATIWEEPLNGTPSIVIKLNATLSEGENTIEVIAWDLAGNPARGQATVLVDTMPPTITIVSPRNASVLSDDNVSVEILVNDPHLSPSQVTVLLDGNPVNLSASTDNGTLILNGTITVPSPGTHVLTVVALDLAGNAASSSTTFYLDLEAPSITAPTLILINSTNETVSISFTDDLLPVLGPDAYSITLTGNATIISVSTAGEVQLRVTSVDNTYKAVINIEITDPAGRTTNKTIYVALGAPANTTLTITPGKPTLVPIPFYTVPQLLASAVAECNATLAALTPSWNTTTSITGEPMIAVIEGAEHCNITLTGYHPPDGKNLYISASGATGIIIAETPVPAVNVSGLRAVYTYDPGKDAWTLTLIEQGEIVGPAKTLQPGHVYLALFNGTNTTAQPAPASLPVESTDREEAHSDNTGVSGVAASIMIPAGVVGVLRSRRRRAAFVIALALLLAGPAIASAAQESSAELVSGPSGAVTTVTGVANLSIKLNVYDSKQTILALKLHLEEGLTIENLTVLMNGTLQSPDNLTTINNTVIAIYNSIDPPTGNLTIMLTAVAPEAGHSYNLTWEVMVTTMRGMVPDLPFEANGTVTIVYEAEETTTQSTTTTTTPQTTTPETTTTTSPETTITTTSPATTNTTAQNTTPQTYPATTTQQEEGGLPGHVIAAIAALVVVAALLAVIRRR